MGTDALIRQVEGLGYVVKVFRVNVEMRAIWNTSGSRSSSMARPAGLRGRTCCRSRTCVARQEPAEVLGD